MSQCKCGCTKVWVDWVSVEDRGRRVGHSIQAVCCERCGRRVALSAHDLVEIMHLLAVQEEGMVER